MAKLKLDLHEIFNQGDRIEQELDRVLHEAIEKRIALVEIIPGKGSGQLKKRVLRYLNTPQVRKLYHRYDVDNRNFGRLFVHFRHHREQ
jgi:dsDNA-specific endonuclease/ATPase MutS2